MLFYKGIVFIGDIINGINNQNTLQSCGKRNITGLRWQRNPPKMDSIVWTPLPRFPFSYGDILAYDRGDRDTSYFEGLIEKKVRGIFTKTSQYEGIREENTGLQST